MKKNNQNIIIAVVTILTIIIWIAGNLYHISVTSTVPEDIQKTLAPFNPNLDVDFLQSLKNKKQVSQFAVSQTASSESAQPTTTPIITSTPIASPSVSLGQ